MDNRSYLLLRGSNHLKISVKILETRCKVRMPRQARPAFALKAQAWRERTCPEGLDLTSSRTSSPAKGGMSKERTQSEGRIHREWARPCWYRGSNLEQRRSTWGRGVRSLLIRVGIAPIQSMYSNNHSAIGGSDSLLIGKKQNLTTFFHTPSQKIKPSFYDLNSFCISSFATLSILSQ